MQLFTKAVAQALASEERDYVARPSRNHPGKWLVWCTTSDHEVEFDSRDIAVAIEDIRWLAANRD